MLQLEDVLMGIDKSPIYTHDRIPVDFFKDKFEHAFYSRSVKKYAADKDQFSFVRAERMDWIKYVLENPTIVPKQEYDGKRRTYDNSQSL